MKLPIRQSLIAQTAEAIREGIRQRVWRTHLPGERDLATHMKVSRPTVRFALEILQHEGWVRTSRAGFRREIAHRPRTRTRLRDRKVTFLTDGLSRLASSYRSQALVDDLREALHANGIGLDVQVYPRASPERLPLALDALVREQPASAWVLTRASREIQEWFARQSLPVLVNGTSYPGVPLPFVGINYRAVGRHAAGVLIRAGYRRLVIVATHTNVAGDDDSEAGFRRTVDTARTTGLNCRIVRFNESRDDLIDRLDSLHLADHRTIGFFCMFAPHAIMLQGYLQRHGLLTTGRCALISRVYDPMLAWTFPRIAHYHQNVSLVTHKIARLTLNMVRGGPLPVKAYRLIPDYVPGETVGRISE